jgi:carbon storage regulator CsrA
MFWRSQVRVLPLQCHCKAFQFYSIINPIQGRIAMLVFARKKGEEIVFPELNITIKLIGMKSAGIMSIGIEAPPEIRVHRKEVYDKILASGDTPPPPAASGPAQAVQLWAARPKRKGNPQS